MIELLCEHGLSVAVGRRDRLCEVSISVGSVFIKRAEIVQN